MSVSLFPWKECAKIIIEFGIKEVVYLSNKNLLKNKTKVALIMFSVCKEVKLGQLDEII